MFLLCCRLHHTRVGQDNGLIFVTARHAIDHDAVEHTRIEVFLLNVDVRARDAAIEHALWNLKFRAFLLHTQQQLIETAVSHRTNYILEIERYEAHQHRDNDERAESLQQ